MYAYGFLAGELGDDVEDALRALDRSVELFVGSEMSQGWRGRSTTAPAVGFTNTLQSRADLDESTELARRNQLPGCVFMNLMVDACWQLTFGEAAIALSIASQALPMARLANAPQGLAHTLELQACASLAMSNVARAGEPLLEALEHHRHVRNVGCSCHALETTAWFLVASGRREDGRTMRDAARGFRRDVHAPPAPYEGFISTYLNRYTAELDAATPLEDLPSNITNAVELGARLVSRL